MSVEVNLSAATGGCDRCLIQGAIDTPPPPDADADGEELVIRLGPGVFRIEPPPSWVSLPNPDRLSLLRTRRNVTIIGSGSARTIIKGVGAIGNRHILAALSGTLTLRGLTIEGADRTSSAEQTHCVNVAEGAYLDADDVIFSMTRGTLDAGDGVKVSGGSVRLTNCRFIDCARSGLTIHRTTGVFVDRCTFSGNRGQDIDIEPPPEGGASNVIIRNCQSTRLGGLGYSLAVTRVTGVEITDCDFDGDICLISARDVKMRRTAAARTLIRRSQMTHLVSCELGPVSILTDRDGISRDIILENCQVTAASGLPAIDNDSGQGVYIINCDLHGAGGAPVVFKAVMNDAWGGVVGGTLSGWSQPILMRPRDHHIPWCLGVPS